MKAQVNKILNELGLVRTEKVFYDRTDDYYYLGTAFFVLQLHLDDYEEITQKAKDKLAEILEEKGEERADVYWKAFDDLEDAIYTKFIIRLKGLDLAIYDIDGEYSYLDQAITLGIEPEEFKVHSKIALVAEVSKQSKFAAIPFRSESADEIIEESDYFKSEE